MCGAGVSAIQASISRGVGFGFGALLVLSKRKLLERRDDQTRVASTACCNTETATMSMMEIEERGKETVAQANDEYVIMRR